MSLKIKITFATERCFLLRSLIKRRAWCEQCNREADFVPSEEMNGLAFRLNKNVGDKGLHKLNETDGKILICLSSILN